MNTWRAKSTNLTKVIKQLNNCCNQDVQVQNLYSQKSYRTLKMPQFPWYPGLAQYNILSACTSDFDHEHVHSLKAVRT